jgi:hypothetical protein
VKEKPLSVVQKSDFYFQCEDANIPAGFIPWHGPCKIGNDRNACELGSDCKERNGKSFCEPKADLIVVPKGQSKCGGGHRAAGKKAGIAFAALACVAALAIITFGVACLTILHKGTTNCFSQQQTLAQKL